MTRNLLQNTLQGNWSSSVGAAYQLYTTECVFLVRRIQIEARRLQSFWSRIQSKTDFDPKEPIVNGDAQAGIDNVIVCVARLSRLLTFIPGKCPYRSRSEERVEYFRNLFAGIVIEEIHAKAARNSLEHFEERIDELFNNEAENERLNLPDPLYSYSMMFVDFPDFNIEIISIFSRCLALKNSLSTILEQG